MDQELKILRWAVLILAISVIALGLTLEATRKQQRTTDTRLNAVEARTPRQVR